MSRKSILHLDLDTFYVSVERKIDSRLKGKPILVGSNSKRGVVAACSYETRSYGVHSGMSMQYAKQLCPEAVVIKGNAGTYSRHSEEVTEILEESMPIFEKASIDEFYADLSGMDKFYGCAKYAAEVREKIIRETGLPISSGLSINKVVSKIATGEAKPNNQYIVNNGAELDFLAPLSIRKIPQVGDKNFHILRELGLRRIWNIQDTDREALVAVMGKNGGLIWDRAHGLDLRPIVPFHARKSISMERTFEENTMDFKLLENILTAMTENLAFQLRRGNKLTGTIAVKIRYSSHNTFTKQRRIPLSNMDYILIPHIIDLYRKLAIHRYSVRLIGIRFSAIASGTHQIDLINDDERILNLYNRMDRMRNKYHDRTLYRANSMGVKTIGKVFNPFNGKPPVVLAYRKV
ncbi:MAG: DNA polymerase IV [Nonlabens sp.]